MFSSFTCVDYDFASSALVTLASLWCRIGWLGNECYSDGQCLA
uniref:Uncharacterized protein n=1 Tax=Arundo donax TaxID=35708 RepID=A0A0A9CUM2_ARUDO